MSLSSKFLTMVAALTLVAIFFMLIEICVLVDRPASLRPSRDASISLSTGYESTVQELAVSETEMEYSTSVGQNAGDYNIISVPDLHWNRSTVHPTTSARLEHNTSPNYISSTPPDQIHSTEQPTLKKEIPSLQQGTVEPTAGVAQKKGLHNNPHSYTLTGRPAPTIQSLQDQLTQCSRAMGLDEQTLDSSRDAITSVATNLSYFLSAFHSIVPQHFLSSYRSPCWESQLSLSHPQQEGLVSLLQTEKKALSDKTLKHILYRRILEPARNRARQTLVCLPAFFLAGFPKCGTTSLHTALFHLPMIVRPSTKEPHWWTRMLLDYSDQEYLRLAVVRYLQFFYKAANTSIKKNHQSLLYDGSQSTLWDSNFFVNNQDYCAMPAAVSHVLPRAKFIVMMRDPVARTYSHYMYSCTLRYSEDISSWPEHVRENVAEVFHEEVVKDIGHFNECRLQNRSVFDCASDKHFSNENKPGCGSVGYRLIVSLYYLHIHKWLQFFPKEQFLFLRLKDMDSDPKTFMTDITDFFDMKQLPSGSASHLLAGHRNTQPVRTKMLPKTRKLLSDFFLPFNQQLVELTGDARFLW